MKEKRDSKLLNNEKKKTLEISFVEKELLHNSLVQREQLKTLKELNNTIKDLTGILKDFESHQFLEIHKSKRKIALYNLSLGMLFAIWTVLWLLILSWSTYHFFKDSTEIKWLIDSQLKLRQFNVQDIKEKVKTEIKNDSEIRQLITNSWTKNGN